MADYEWYVIDEIRIRIFALVPFNKVSYLQASIKNALMTCYNERHLSSFF